MRSEEWVGGTGTLTVRSSSLAVHSSSDKVGNKAEGIQEGKQIRALVLHTAQSSIAEVHELTSLNRATKERKLSYLPHTSPRTATGRANQPGCCRHTEITFCRAQVLRYNCFSQKPSLQPQTQSPPATAAKEPSHSVPSAQVQAPSA